MKAECFPKETPISRFPKMVPSIIKSKITNVNHEKEHF